MQKGYHNKNWLGREGFNFLQTLTGKELKKWKNSVGLYQILDEELKAQYKKTILLL